MEVNKVHNFIRDVLANMPQDWLNLTTHRLDIYNEKLAKTEFLEHIENLFGEHNAVPSRFVGVALSELPTAYDYIRLGHPLSCILEWTIAKLSNHKSENVVSFSSQTMPLLAILRKNALENKSTIIIYKDKLPIDFDSTVLKEIYGYQFKLIELENADELDDSATTIFLSQVDDISKFNPPQIRTDFLVNVNADLGSILLMDDEQDDSYISDIQHVRRRETIAMTPANCLFALNVLIQDSSINPKQSNIFQKKEDVLGTIKKITGAPTRALLASSGLSIQYAIMMGLVHDALENHKDKTIKFVVPSNCYGGTNDQARRVAESISNVEIVDLLVDDGSDMVQSINEVLDNIAKEDAIPYIIAEIPTNPRVEVPDLTKLRDTLSKVRKTANGEIAIDPVFILDQTFCPNVHFLGEGEVLSMVRSISYASGSKFPSGGLCNAGYCVGNTKSQALMDKIELHLKLCDNEATNLQVEILAKQLPSMKQRIHDAYVNTREFVNFIKENLPEAKINFVTEDLAKEGFTPSVFSLDLPTKGNSDEERETYKRALNHKLINLMIIEIPNESKYCVSYGQLQGCYWTIPATSTQGTTKEDDKDYIARVALSPKMNLNLHKKVFLEFIESI